MSLWARVIGSGASATYTLEIGNGVHVTLSWVSGQWASECSFVVKYEDGETIYSTSSPSGGVLYQFDCNCAGSAIVGNFTTVENIEYTMDGYTLTLVWNALPDAIGYVIYRNGLEVAHTDTNEYSEEIPMELDYTYCIVAEYAEGMSAPECVVLTDLLGVNEMSDVFTVYPNPVNS